MINDSITVPYINESEIIICYLVVKRDGIPAFIAKQLINSYIKPLTLSDPGYFRQLTIGGGGL